MNKKRLSVVMAGAMLASSVAPVMAAQVKDQSLNGNTTAHNPSNNKYGVGINNLIVTNEDTKGTDTVYGLDTRSEKKYEVNGINRGELVAQLRELMLSKVYSNTTGNNISNITLNSGITVSTNFAGESAYMVYVLNKNKTEYSAFTNVSEAGIKAMERAVNDAPVGAKVFVIDRGHVVDKGLVHKTYVEDNKVQTRWTETELRALAATSETDLKNNYPAVNNFEWVEPADPAKETGYLKVTLRKTVTDENQEIKCEELTVKPNDLKVDFKLPLNKDGGSLKDYPWNAEGVWQTLDKFAPVYATATNKAGKIIDANLLASVSITSATSKEVVKLSELYDGLFLTTKGNELLESLKYDYKAKDNRPAANDPQGLRAENIKAAFVASKYDLTLGEVAGVVNQKNGIYTLDIAFNTYERNKTTKERTSKLVDSKVITVSSNNKKQLELFRVWMHNRKPQVDVLAGDDRYETAVKIAKNNANITDVAENGNIVLVNGDALVDGLAAAPLAASVWNKDGVGSKVAPILLTKSDSIPKATADYMKELIAEQRFGEMDKVTVYLVGGETVISPAIEKQLKDFGLRVVRAGGANREETSLKVAEVMAKDANRWEDGTTKVDMSHAFVVGAEGEADAMSIAAVAAREGNPIIVESKNGLSEKALDEITKWKHDFDYANGDKLSATIVGGESVVSKATLKKLQSKDIATDRVHGSNRQKTNAAVIRRYYKTEGINHVVVSKDGSNNKKRDLIDALTATSLSVQHKAPIVLGTNKLDIEQMSALNQKANRTGVYVYQVGHGVARDVVKAIANRFSLSK